MPTSGEYAVKLEAKELFADTIRKQLGEALEWKNVSALEGTDASKVEQFQKVMDEVVDLRKGYDESKAIEKRMGEVLVPPSPPSPKDPTAVIQKGGPMAELHRLVEKFSNGNEADRMGGMAAKVALKTLFQGSTTGGWDVVDQFSGLVVPDAVQPVSLIPFIPSVPTDQANVVYMEETTHTNNAAARVQGGALGEAAIVYTKRIVPVASIGTWMPVVDEIIEDVPMLMALLTGTLRFMVMSEFDDEILNGGGTGGAWTGLKDLAGTNSQAKGSDDTLTAFRKGITKVRTTGKAQPSLIIINPEDMEDVALARAITAASLASGAVSENTVNTYNGEFLMGHPAMATPGTLWGIPYVESERASAGTGYVGDFARFSMIRERQDYIVEQGYRNDDFSKLQKTLRAYVRGVFFATRAAAFTKVTGI